MLWRTYNTFLRGRNCIFQQSLNDPKTMIDENTNSSYKSLFQFLRVQFAIYNSNLLFRIKIWLEEPINTFLRDRNCTYLKCQKRPKQWMATSIILFVRVILISEWVSFKNTLRRTYKYISEGYKLYFPTVVEWPRNDDRPKYGFQLQVFIPISESAICYI